ncbi:protein syd : Uncharacterized protein OS=Endozoicomonas numazuensis GN=GZ78_23580 PE=4 SV=1: Syd [Gemmataceae bacterium]|nr:protein syd : Uncharacterized protein OS=Endozoicomonas numazuensis GN=GZ78_23580 PE=4 SV=1: Syd [Gemmataceae bacterium]VTU01214.1 protein syd : Uncharacterized protein OS=Endozoicomonas numazuensis GN=GZ78_23580 PE=4 SV=1: Syd [Gemmataceae bacterium]
MGDVAYALLRLLNRASLLRVDHDPARPSPCEQLPPDHHGLVEWRPVPVTPPAAFDGIAIHPSIREFYGSYLGGEADGHYAGEAVHLITAWEVDGLARFARTVRAQVESEKQVTVAYTDREQLYAVDNATGAVWLCEPDQQPIRQVARSLAEFLNQIG